MGSRVIPQRVLQVVQQTLLLIVVIKVIRYVHQVFMVMAVVVWHARQLINMVYIQIQRLQHMRLGKVRLILHLFLGVIFQLGPTMIQQEQSVLLLRVITVRKNPRLGIF